MAGAGAITETVVVSWVEQDAQGAVADAVAGAAGGADMTAVEATVVEDAPAAASCQ